MNRDENLLEKKLSGERIFSGKIIDVERWDVELPDGHTAGREVVLHRGAAAVVPVDAQGRVAMVRQYRAPLQRVLLEIPAGKLDTADEEPFLCAQRELREETGLVADGWRFLNDIVTTPGFCSEHIALYLATQLHQGETQPDDDEFLDVLWIPMEELVEQIMRGQIRDSKTCVAILMAHRVLNAPQTL